MTFYLRTCSAALLFALLHSACNSTTEKKSLTEINPDTITITKNNIAIPEKLLLKETVLNEKTVITSNR